jgi:hypothetical protein
MNEPESKPSKQPYSPPRLVTYGDITQLTQSTVTGKQSADGGGKLKPKQL